MDKRKVITAYRRGFITIKECAQILGVDSVQIMRWVHEPFFEEAHWPRQTKPVSSAQS